MAKVRHLLARQDVREIGFQSDFLHTRFTIRLKTKVYDFGLPGTSGLVAFARVIQEQLEVMKRERHETP